MCLSNKQTNTRYCLFDRLEKFCLFVWSEVVKRTKQSVQVLFGDHPGRADSSAGNERRLSCHTRLTGQAVDDDQMLCNAASKQTVASLCLT